MATFCDSWPWMAFRLSAYCLALFAARCCALSAEKSDDTHPVMSLLYITRSMMPVVRPVCQEKSEESTCRHTGVAF